MEIYTEVFPRPLTMRSFADVASVLSSEHDLLLIGVVSEATLNVMLAPGGGYQIQPADSGIFIASSAAFIDQVFNLIEEDAEASILAASLPPSPSRRPRQFPPESGIGVTSTTTSMPIHEIPELSSAESEPSSSRHSPRATSSCAVAAARPSAVNVEVRGRMIPQSPRGASLRHGSSSTPIRSRRGTAESDRSERSIDQRGGSIRSERRLTLTGDLGRWRRALAFAKSDKEGGGKARNMHVGDRRLPTERDEYMLQQKMIQVAAMRAQASAIGEPEESNGLPVRSPCTRESSVIGGARLVSPRTPSCLDRGGLMGSGGYGKARVGSGGAACAADLRVDPRVTPGTPRTSRARPISEAILCASQNPPPFWSVGLKGHIVIFTSSLTALRHFIAPLRQPSLPHVPILVLTPLRGEAYQHAASQWIELCTNQGVFLLDAIGDLNIDGPRAALSHASSIIIRASWSESEQASAASANDRSGVLLRADASTLLATLQAEELCGPNTNIICEILHGSTLSQLAAEPVGASAERQVSSDSIGDGVRRSSTPSRDMLPAEDGSPPTSTKVGNGSSFTKGAHSVDAAANLVSKRPGTLRRWGTATGSIFGIMSSTEAAPREKTRNLKRESSSPHAFFDETAEAEDSLHFVDEWGLGSASTSPTLPVFENADGEDLVSQTVVGDQQQEAYTHGGSFRMPQMASCFASGKVLLSDIVDKLSSQAFFNAHAMPIFSALINPTLHNDKHGDYAAASGVDSGGVAPRSAHLTLISIPTEFKRIAVARAATYRTANATAPSDRSCNPASAVPRVADPFATPPIQRERSCASNSGADTGYTATPDISASVPDAQCTWGQLWDWLLSEFGVIAIGLYVRSPQSEELNLADASSQPEPPDTTPLKDLIGRTIKTGKALAGISTTAQKGPRRCSLRMWRDHTSPTTNRPSAGASAKSSEAMVARTEGSVETSERHAVEAGSSTDGHACRAQSGEMSATAHAGESRSRASFVDERVVMRTESAHTGGSKEESARSRCNVGEQSRSGSRFSKWRFVRRRRMADNQQKQGIASVSGGAYSAYVVTSPQRSQCLREGDLVFALLPPAALSNPRLVKAYSLQLPSGRAAEGMPHDRPRASANEHARTSVPASVPPIITASMANQSVSELQRPAPVAVHDPPETASEADQLRAEVATLTAAITDERERTDQLLKVLRSTSLGVAPERS